MRVLLKNQIIPITSLDSWLSDLFSVNVGTPPVQRVTKTWNKLKSVVARFTTQIQMCLTTNQVVAGCKTLLQKLESSSPFCNKIYTCWAVQRPKANFFSNKWDNFRVYCDFRVILTNQKLVSHLNSLICCKTALNVNIAIQLVCSNAAKQIACFCYPFSRSFKVAGRFGNSPHVSTELVWFYSISNRPFAAGY